jgi:hypothetical protein
VALTLNSPLWLVTLLSCALPAGAAQPRAPAAEDDPGLTRAKEIQALHEADLFRVQAVHAVGLGKNEAGEWVVHVYAGTEADRRALPEQLDELKVSTSNNQECQAGTIGFRVCDADNHNIIGYVTNNHIAARDISGCPNGRGITGGCALGLYCPAAPVSRAENSVFVRATFY